MTSFPTACLRSGPVRRGRARRGSLLLALLSVFALAACRPPPPVAAVRAAWDWKTFPEGRSLLVAQLPATVGPARSQVFRASEAGRLTLEVAQHAVTLPADSVWGTLEPVGAADETAELEHAAALLAQRRAHWRDAELPAARLRFDLEITEAEKARALLDLAAKEPDLFTPAGAGLDPHLLPAGTAAQAAENIRLLRASRAALDDPATSEPPELAAAQLDLDRRTAARQRHAALNRLAMPFAGELLLAGPWPPVPERDVAPGEVLAQARDLSRLRLRVPVAFPALADAAGALPLTATVTLGGGRTIEAPFAFQQIEPGADGGDGPCLYFEAPATVLQGAPFPPPGLELACDVRAQLPESARLVPKLALVLADADGVFADGWKAGLARRWPGARLLAEGRAELAIVPPPAPP
jgi:hypothetical protein